YFFSGKFTTAPVTLTFIAGSWQDVAGNAVQEQQIGTAAAPGTAATPGTFKRGPFIDVTFDPTNEARVDPQTINGDEFTLTGADGENLVFDKALQVNDVTFRYSFNGQFNTGPLTVQFVAGAWADTEGNAGTARTEKIQIVSTAKVFFIELSGGITLQAAGLIQEPLMEAKAQATLEIDAARKVFTLSFS